MDRRSFLVSLAAGATYGPTGRSRPPVNSDVERLDRVLVHTPGPETQYLLPRDPLAAHRLPVGVMTEEGVAHHDRLVEHLAGHGVEVLSFQKLLDEAIVECDRQGALTHWLIGARPQLVGEEHRITGAALIGAVEEFVLRHDCDGNLQPLTPPLPCLFFTRDLATMTPRGLVLSRFVNADRAFESTLFRFLLSWSPKLKSTPIAFDAQRERVYLQGGDLIVLDEETLLLGVGNLSEEAAARKLAEKLDLDVVCVRLPGDGRFHGDIVTRWNRLRTLFLHLDSVFSLVDHRAALAAPYVFEARFTNRSSLERLMAAFRAGLREQPGSWRTFRDLGRIRRYRAGSGEIDRSTGEQKLVDFLRERDYRIISAGDLPPDSLDERAFRDRALPELLNQAANVVAVQPGRVLAYEENTATNRALSRAGVKVTTFPGEVLGSWHGGPHCLTLPLNRSAPA